MSYTFTRTGAQIEEIHNTVDDLQNIVSNDNLISNSSFEIAGNVTNPPDATPRSYNAGDELFQGMFAVGALTGVTYIDGKANGTGQLYTDVYKSQKQKLSTSNCIASIAGSNGSPVESGASFVDNGDYWRVTFDMTNTFSIKLEKGGVATLHSAKPIVSDVVDARLYGLTGIGDESDVIEKLIRLSNRDNAEIFIPQNFSVSVDTDIDVSDIDGYFAFTSSYVGLGRKLISQQMAELVFNDDGTSLGRVGIDGGDTLTPSFTNIRLKTKAADVRGTAGDFIGFKGRGNDSSVRNCDISGMSQALALADLGYAYWGGNYYHGNKRLLTHRLNAWVAGTTFYDDRSVSVQNNDVYDVPFLTNSHWSNGIHEFNNSVIKDVGNGCSDTGSYYEANANGSVNSPVAAADFTTFGCHYNSTNDLPVTSNNTGVHGFDRCGRTEVNQSDIKSKKVQFYDRAGFTSDYLKASAIQPGKIQQFDRDDNLLGNNAVIQGVSDRPSRTIHDITVILSSGLVLGLPAGWTYVRNSAGDFTIGFGADVKFPNVTIGSTSNNIDINNKVQAFYNMTESSSGNWLNFQNANGVRVRTEVNSTLSDITVTSIKIII